MIAKIPKGRHTKWRFPKRVKSPLKYRVRFLESAIYNHKDNDQYDWNKLFGIKEKFFRPMFNSEMIGWRWNNEKGVVELCDYWHIEGDREIRMIGEVHLYDWIELEVSGNGFETGGKGWLILNWFGGQKKAPHDIKIEMIRL